MMAQKQYISSQYPSFVSDPFTQFQPTLLSALRGKQPLIPLGQGEQQNIELGRQFTQDPLSSPLVGGYTGALRNLLQPSADIARRNLADTFRQQGAGTLQSGAFAKSSADLERDLYQREADTLMRATAELYPQFRQTIAQQQQAEALPREQQEKTLGFLQSLLGSQPVKTGYIEKPTTGESIAEFISPLLAAILGGKTGTLAGSIGGALGGLLGLRGGGGGGGGGISGGLGTATSIGSALAKFLGLSSGGIDVPAYTDVSGPGTSPVDFLDQEFGDLLRLGGSGGIDAFTDLAGAGTSAWDFLDQEFGNLFDLGALGFSNAPAEVATAGASNAADLYMPGSILETTITGQPPGIPANVPSSALPIPFESPAYTDIFGLGTSPVDALDREFGQLLQQVSPTALPEPASIAETIITGQPPGIPASVPSIPPPIEPLPIPIEPPAYVDVAGPGTSPLDALDLEYGQLLQQLQQAAPPIPEGQLIDPTDEELHNLWTGRFNFGVPSAPSEIPLDALADTAAETSLGLGGAEWGPLGGGLNLGSIAAPLVSTGLGALMQAAGAPPMARGGVGALATAALGGGPLGIIASAVLPFFLGGMKSTNLDLAEETARTHEIYREVDQAIKTGAPVNVEDLRYAGMWLYPDPKSRNPLYELGEKVLDAEEAGQPLERDASGNYIFRNVQVQPLSVLKDGPADPLAPPMTIPVVYLSPHHYAEIKRSREFARRDERLEEERLEAEREREIENRAQSRDD